MICQQNLTQQNSHALEAEQRAQRRRKRPEETADLEEGRRSAQNIRNRESYRRKHPDWRPRRKNHTPITQQFILDNVFVDATTGCWIWTRGTSKGYGRIWDGSRFVQTHRAAYELWVAPIPVHLFACHHCDNRRCCNPKHIFIGNQFDNMRDAAKKGRTVASARKVDDAQVKAIRESDKSAWELAIEFGVSWRIVHRIKTFETFKQL